MAQIDNYDERKPLISTKENYDTVNNVNEEIRNVLSGDSSVNNDLTNSEIVFIHQAKLKVYKRRWYVLFMFSFLGTVQNLIWNTWGPISDSAKDAFGWTDADIGLLSNWGPISFLISGIFFSWMIDVKGLRISCIFSMFLVATGAGLRCITSSTPLSTWLIHIGQFLNGFGGPVGMAGSPTISATWFPSNERTTATSIAVLIPNILGLAGSFLIGPMLVPSHSSQNTSHINESNSYIEDYSEYFTYPNSSNSSSRIEEERKNIMFLMYIEFGLAALVFVVMLIYFPNKPPLPPCLSASTKREDFWTGLKALFRCKQFWLIAFAYGASGGVCNCWSGNIDLILSPLNISQNEAGWIGFYATCASCVCSLIVGRLADIFSKHLKMMIIMLYFVAAVAMTVFSLACIKIVPPSSAVFYVTIIFAVIGVNAGTPLLYELGCELSYPIGEGTTNGMMTIMNNFGGLIFLFILMAPKIGTIWMNWTFLGSIVICFPLYGLLKETYNRLDLDTSSTQQSSATTTIVYQ